MSWSITAFYKFFAIGDMAATQAHFEGLLSGLDMVGLIIVAPEGINGTVAGSPESVATLKERIREYAGDVGFKDSFADRKPFGKVSVIVRPEIVSLRRPDIQPRDNAYVSACDWHAMLGSEEPKLVIDTRNRYETRIGTFRGAIDPDLARFSEWPAYVESLDVDRRTPVFLFCTGGIRCEKASVAMEQAGFEKVYQLRDGILGYLAEYPDDGFEGECFVFDERVAVDGKLRPSERYALCLRCGTPTEQRAQCIVCGQGGAWCRDCHAVCKGCQVPHRSS